MNYKLFIRNDGHGLIVIRLLEDAPMTEEELKTLERMARRGQQAFAFHNNRLVCEVEYIPQN